MTIEFTQLGLRSELVQAVVARGYTTPTPIQASVIPVLLSGRDVIGQAQTGTGKTAAFALPMLQMLTPRKGSPQALVLAPTRELAIQVAEAIQDYSQFSQVAVLPVYGGAPYPPQINQLRRGVDVVVGTPGRLIDLLERKVLDLTDVQMVVLDEADEMLSMGFMEDIKKLLETTPATRQTALFSATLPREIRQLAEHYLQNPQSVTVQHSQLTVAAIEQRYYVVQESDKLAALTRLFEVEPMTSTLIFARTRSDTAELAHELTARGFMADVLNGDLTQQAREQVLNRFRQNQIAVLVATDVAARGLDIDNISHVVNFDLPLDAEVFVHRVGRTGRAGKTGVAITLVAPKEQWRLGKIEQYTKQKMKAAKIPSAEEIKAQREAQLLKQMNIWLQRGRCTREREIVSALVEAGHDILDVAAVALKLARSEEKQRPIESISVAPTQPERKSDRPSSAPSGRMRSYDNKTQEKGMVRLSLNAGKQHGLRPNDIVGTIAYHADIPGSTIGAIRIQDEHSLIDVPERFVAQVLAKTGNYRVRQQRLSITLSE
jgi:ATP-dependent RNA helicase DeaD